MLIDWFTVFAQLINFLILIWLLKRFLYKPIIDAIDARETLIADKLSQAQKIKHEAESERLQLIIKLEEIDDKRAEVLKTASLDAKDERERLFDDAKKEIVLFSEKKHRDFIREEKDIHHSIIIKSQKEILSITRKVLLDLSGTNFESHLIDVFVLRLSELDEKQKINIDEGILKTAFEIDTNQRSCIEDAIHNCLGIKVNLKFEVDPELLSGIEFITNGQKLAWSINDYLSSLEEEVDQILHFNGPAL
jgi:F-type H+-transporting ATPase subunit b